MAAPKEEKQSSVEDKIKNYEIKKSIVKTALVALVCVKDYAPKKSNLVNTVVDRNAMALLFKKYKYEVMVPHAKGEVKPLERITHSDFLDFIGDVRSRLVTESEKFDALFVVFSGHGTEDSLMLSDWKSYDRVALYKYFNGKECHQFNDKLKMLVLDACKGPDDAQPTSLSKSKGGDDPKETQHPDYNIVIWESNSDGYASTDYDGKGGALIQAFTDVMGNNGGKLPLYKLKILVCREMEQLTGKRQLLKYDDMGIDQLVYFQAPWNGGGGDDDDDDVKSEETVVGRKKALPLKSANLKTGDGPSPRRPAIGSKWGSVNSAILGKSMKKKENFLDMLFHQLQYEEPATVQCELLYSGTKAGFEVQPFLDNSQGISGTVLLVETTKGHTFGGYTNVAWKGEGYLQADPTAFLFRIQAGNKQVFPLKKGKEEHAVCHSTGDGRFFPQFGGYDLFIYANCDKNKSSCSSPTCYAFNGNDVCGAISNNSDGRPCFQVKEMELFHIV